MNKGTYPLVANAIRTYGAERVRKIVYGEHSALVTNEAVAMSNFIDSRMFKKDIKKEIKNLK